MNLRKILLLLLIMSLLATSLVSCGDKNDNARENLPTKTLNVYNWGEYISDEDDPESGLIDVNAAFEEYFNENLASEYGYYVRVNYSTYATNEDMYAKIKNSAVSYDIIIPSDYMIEKMISENLLKPIDKSKLENYSNINESFLDPYYDPDSQYSVPYTYGMLGIIYNSEFVKDEPDVERESWDLLWNPKYAGKILQFNNPRDAFATAMYKEGLDINSTDPKVWNQALTYLQEQKPLLQGYVNDEIFNKMKGASAYIAPYYAGDFLTMAAANDDLRFYYPDEGTNYFVDAMCIPVTSDEEKYDLAIAYIDFMISEKAATANALYIGYASPNNKVTGSKYYADMLSANYDTEYISAWDILYGKTVDEVNEKYPYDTAAYKDYYKDGAIDIQAHVISLWETLKTQNSTEPWIHITSIAIVVGVISLATHSTYTKKKRSRDYRLRDKMKQQNKK